MSSDGRYQYPIRNAIRDYGYEHRLTFHDQREHAGLLRNMMIRNSNTGELMLLMQFCITNDTEKAQAEALMGYLAKHSRRLPLYYT